MTTPDPMADTHMTITNTLAEIQIPREVWNLGGPATDARALWDALRKKAPYTSSSARRLEFDFGYFGDARTVTVRLIGESIERKPQPEA